MLIRPFQWIAGNSPGQRIKYVGELHDGKIGCCCTPVDCCLYPAQDPLGVPAYPADDLPDSIIVTSTEGTETIPRDTGARTYTGAIYTVVELAGMTSQWHVLADIEGIPTIMGISTCLFGEYGTPSTTVSDEFASSYSATYGVYDPITLTRSSLCMWEGSGTGTEDQPYTIQMSYNDTIFKWQIVIFIESTTFDPIKDDPQSAPTGDYGGLVTVS